MLDAGLECDRIRIGPTFASMFQRRLRLPDDRKSRPLPPGEKYGTLQPPQGREEAGGAEGSNGHCRLCAAGQFRGGPRQVRSVSRVLMTMRQSQTS